MCEYCEPNKHGIRKPMAKRGIGFSTPLVDIQRDENTNKLVMLVHYDGEEPLKIAIKLCPMCGRKLINQSTDQ